MRAIAWQPTAGMVARMCAQYLPIVLGWSVTCVRDLAGVEAVAPDIRPQFVFAPPALWAQLRATVVAQADDDALATVGLDETSVALVGPAPCLPPDDAEFWNDMGLALRRLDDDHGGSFRLGRALVPSDRWRRRPPDPRSPRNRSRDTC